MIKLLTNLFDGAVSSDAFVYRTQMGGHFRVVMPYAVLLVASTIERLSDTLPESARQGGFTNRFLFFYSEQFRPKAFPQAQINIASLFEKVHEEYIELSMRNSVLNWTPEAQQLFTEWYEDTRGGATREDEPEMLTWVSRLGIFLIKISGISCLCDNRIYIEKQDLDFAWNIMALARCGYQMTMRLTGANKQAWLELQLVKFLLDQQTGTTSIPTIKASKLCRNFVSDASAFEIRRILYSLSELGVVGYLPDKDLVIAKIPAARDYLKEPKIKDYDLSWERVNVD